jgi:hypothetical protein
MLVWYYNTWQVRQAARGLKGSDMLKGEEVTSTNTQNCGAVTAHESIHAIKKTLVLLGLQDEI